MCSSNGSASKIVENAPGPSANIVQIELLTHREIRGTGLVSLGDPEDVSSAQTYHVWMRG